MSLSMHEASVVIMLRMLDNLSTILAKAAAHAEANRLDPSTLIEARLAPDMYALARQVQIASDTAKGCAARLAGMQPPSFPDEEKTFPELQERIAKTMAFLRSVPPEKVEGSAERPVILKAGDREIAFVGRTYLQNFALPNFFFHVTTAYDILRHKGLAIGKLDYLGEL
jgi:hypothetical protein